MKAHAIFPRIDGGIAGGIAAALLLTAMAGGASAQARYYPDGTNCSLLSDDELVGCQNQIYARQLESGISQQAADPTEVPSSHIEGHEAALPDFVPGAEGTAPPSAFEPVAPSPSTSLEGPEGTRVYVPTE